MPSQNVPLANVWKGINKRLAPHLISEQESPDSVNTDFKAGQVGILSGRKGAAKLSDTAYAAPILGILPARFPGIDPPDRILVVGNDGTVTDDPAPFTDGTAWGGPTVNTGFVVKWEAPFGPSDVGSPASDLIGCNILLNGAKTVLANLPSCSKVNSIVTLQTWVQFDDGFYELVNSGVLSTAGCCASTHAITVSPTPVDCSGKIKLTGIQCFAIEVGNAALILSGEIYVLGTSGPETIV
jgi:hypothetical protein